MIQVPGLQNILWNPRLVQPLPICLIKKILENHFSRRHDHFSEKFFIVMLFSKSQLGSAT
ncbi:hypothetical protein C1646_713660 [Rhizophagus diaphanus]|nr:hypothetical protein C1646_713660 [Rhizophagus diaphanus] [Rhizophagus sp. MUCL 43196]